MRCIPARSEPGFSLIELLTVIAVVGVLVAITLPALFSSRATARAVECRAQLAQAGRWIAAYTAHSGYLPPIIRPNAGSKLFHLITTDRVPSDSESLNPVELGVCPADRRDPVPEGSSYMYAAGASIVADWFMTSIGTPLTASARAITQAYENRVLDRSDVIVETSARTIDTKQGRTLRSRHPGQPSPFTPGFSLYFDGHVDWASPVR